MVQWIRIRLPMQVTQVQSLVWEDPRCMEQLSPCAIGTEPVLESLGATATEALASTACALQQEKLPPGEACTPKQAVGPSRHQLEKARLGP